MSRYHRGESVEVIDHRDAHCGKTGKVVSYEKGRGVLVQFEHGQERYGVAQLQLADEEAEIVVDDLSKQRKHFITFTQVDRNGGHSALVLDARTISVVEANPSRERLSARAHIITKISDMVTPDFYVTVTVEEIRDYLKGLG